MNMKNGCFRTRDLYEGSYLYACHQKLIRLLAKQGSESSAHLTKRSIKDYCQQIERRLDSLRNDFEGKRYLLSLIVNGIVLEGKRVKIKGIIPAYTQERPAFSDIASTSSRCCGRNSTFEFELVASLS